MGEDEATQKEMDPSVQQFQEAGVRFLTAFYSLLRTAGFHDFNNRALNAPTTVTFEVLSEFFDADRDRLTVVAVDGQFYLGDLRIQVPASTYHLVGELEQLLGQREVGSITFDAAVAIEELRRFAYVFQRGTSINATADGQSIEEVLARSGIRNIRVGGPVRLELDAEIDGSVASGDPQADTTIRYAKAVTALSRLIADPTGGQRLNRILVNRIVQQMTDCAGETIHYLVGLTEFAAPVDDRARLAVDTCVVAVALARSMGLERRFIADLGVAALRVSLGGDEKNPVGTSSFIPESLKQLAMQPHWSASSLRRALVRAQRGEPVRSSAGMPDQHRLARIYRAAHDYVAWTHGFSPSDGTAIVPLAPLDALYKFTQAPPHVYDDLVVGHLVQVVGLYPVGTLVLLSDSRQAFVVSRDRIGQPVLLIRVSPGNFGDRLPLHETGSAIVGVLTSVDPDERAAAVLGLEAMQRVHDISRGVAEASKLARVSVRQITVRRPRKDS